jgi:uncharacterized protein YjbI with pentapeptide repeats
MMNQEHLEILKQGVKVWNDWRKANPEVIPNLSRANLRELDLREVNFKGAKLLGVNLADAKLNRAELRGARLGVAYLIGANFSAANLSYADLNNADLSCAKLSHANLNGADFREANLHSATLVEADLSGTCLVEADLRKAELRGAILWGAILDEANLSQADFREANLSCADLVATQALATRFEKAILTGVCIKDWHTNSATNFNDVICDYIYLEIDQQERRPHSDTEKFVPGEFTKLFQKARETVDLIFRNGVDWQAFLVSFEQLQVESGDKALFIQAIENKNDGSFVIRVSVPPELDKSKIEQYFKRKYQLALESKDRQYQKYLREKLKDKDILIDSYSEQITSIRQNNIQLTEIIKTMAEKEISRKEYTFYAPVGSVENQGHIASSGNQNNIGNAAGEAQAEMKTIQHNYALEQKQTLAEAAAEIQQLLKQLEQTNPTATETQQIEHINDETTPKFKKRVVGALQATGEAAIDEFVLENKYLKVAKAAIKGWIKPE